MAISDYTSIFTGEEIDAAIQKIRSMEWNTEVISASSGIKGSSTQTGILWESLDKYPLIILTGYKEGVPDYQQTTSIILSTTAIKNRGDGEKQLNVPFSVRDGSFNPWNTTLLLWRDGGALHWETATEYSGSKEFIVTRVEGLDLTKDDEEESAVSGRGLPWDFNHEITEVTDDEFNDEQLYNTWNSEITITEQAHSQQLNTLKRICSKGYLQNYDERLILVSLFRNEDNSTVSAFFGARDHNSDAGTAFSIYLYFQNNTYSMISAYAES